MGFKSAVVVCWIFGSAAGIDIIDVSPYFASAFEGTDQILKLSWLIDILHHVGFWGDFFSFIKVVSWSSIVADGVLKLKVFGSK